MKKQLKAYNDALAIYKDKKTKLLQALQPYFGFEIFIVEQGGDDTCIGDADTSSLAPLDFWIARLNKNKSKISREEFEPTTI
jgi:hypothetical protein